MAKLIISQVENYKMGNSYLVPISKNHKASKKLAKWLEKVSILLPLNLETISYTLMMRMKCFCSTVSLSNLHLLFLRQTNFSTFYSN